jgi:O-methyltransferase
LLVPTLDRPVDQAADAVSLYLDLLKRSLTGALAEDNDSILGGVRTAGSTSWKRRVANSVGQAASKVKVEIVYKKPYDPKEREMGRDWPARAESMIGLRRMENIQQCVQTLLDDDVPGDLIETGVWRGGACIFMKANLLARCDSTRTVWVADSFQGLPRPNAALYPADTGDDLHTRAGLSVGAEQVRHNFERYGVLDERVKFLVGWFKDTLPTAPIEALSLMRLDGDMYESTWQAIEALYPKLSSGGFCIVDDFGSHRSQAGQAVADYRKAHGIEEEIVDIDGFGAYWRKAGSRSAARGRATPRRDGRT